MFFLPYRLMERRLITPMTCSLWLFIRGGVMVAITMFISGTLTSLVSGSQRWAWFCVFHYIKVLKAFECDIKKCITYECHCQEEDCKPKTQKKVKEVQEVCEAKLQTDEPLSVLTAIIAQVVQQLFLDVSLLSLFSFHSMFHVHGCSLSARNHQSASWWTSWARNSWIRLVHPGTKSLESIMVQ